MRVKRARERHDGVGLSLIEIRTFLDVEDLRRVLKSEYDAADDPAIQLAVLDRAEPVVRRRIAMFDRKLALVAALRAEDETRLERIAALRHERRTRVTGGLLPAGSERN